MSMSNRECNVYMYNINDLFDGKAHHILFRAGNKWRARSEALILVLLDKFSFNQNGGFHEVARFVECLCLVFLTSCFQFLSCRRLERSVKD